MYMYILVLGLPGISKPGYPTGIETGTRVPRYLFRLNTRQFTSTSNYPVFARHSLNAQGFPISDKMVPDITPFRSFLKRF